MKTEKSPENLILAKGNNSCKSRSSVTKLKLDLFYVMTNSYTKFQVNISNDDREKSENGSVTDRLTDGQMDGQTDWQTVSKLRVPPASRWGTNNTVYSFEFPQSSFRSIRIQFKVQF